MTLPTDGFGVYESTTTLGNPTGVYQPRLQQIAAGGFKVLINYSLLYGHIVDITAYINYAASLGLKVIVSLHDPRIWRDNTYASNYPNLYADSGNAATGILFAQYIIAQTKNLAGVWGWYIGDEPTPSDHAALATYAAAIQAADTTHPRLAVMNGGSTGSVASGASLYYDSCDVIGDDYYPFGRPFGAYALNTAKTAAANQIFASSHGLGSCLVLQAHNLTDYSIPTGVWPTEAQMQQSRDDAVNNMKPRLILFYSYYNVIESTAPAQQWTYLVDAIANRSGVILFPTAKRRGVATSTNTYGSATSYVPRAFGSVLIRSGIVNTNTDYVATVLANHPTAYYRLNETLGTTALDSSGNGYHGTISSRVTVGQVPGPVLSPPDACVLYNPAGGSGAYISLPSGLKTDGWTTLTIEAWVNLSSNLFTYAPIILCNDAAPNTTHVGFQLTISAPNTANTTGVMLLGNGTSTVSVPFWTGYHLVPGTWYHIVATYDGTNVVTYVNGVAYGYGSITGTIGTATQVLTIGANSAGNVGFPGYIGQVALNQAALSISQIVTDYRAGIGTFQSTSLLFPTATRRQS